MASRAAGYWATDSCVNGGDSTPAASGRHASGVIRFGPFELDFGRYELRRHGTPVALEPRTFDLVALLARNRGRTVTRDEIFRDVWPAGSCRMPH